MKAFPSRSFVRKVASWKEIKVISPGFHIEANGKILQSQANKPLTFPNEHFAFLFAEEWAIAGQDPKTIVNSPVTMATQRVHLLQENPKERAQAISQMTKYLETDTLLFWNAQEANLLHLQASQWKPLLEWMNGIGIAGDLPLQETTSLKSPVYSQQISAFSQCLAEFDDWKLAGFELATKISKSVIVSCALQRQKLNFAEAFRISQLEEQYQMDKWGNLPEFHEIHRADLQRLMALAAIMMQMPVK